MKRLSLYACLLLCSACASAPAPKSAAPIPPGWQVSATHSGANDGLCYAVSAPVSSEGTLGQRDGKAYLMATRRLSGKIEISASAGYAFKPGSKVELAVDDDTYSLFYKDSIAWARGDDDDSDIVDSLGGADDIQVRGLSKANLTSVDHYPSEGFDEAIKRIRELCP